MNIYSLTKRSLVTTLSVAKSIALLIPYSHYSTTMSINNSNHSGGINWKRIIDLGDIQNGKLYEYQYDMEDHIVMI